MCHSPGPGRGPGRGQAGRARPGPARAAGHGAQPCGTQDGVRFSPKARMPSCPSSEAK